MLDIHSQTKEQSLINSFKIIGIQINIINDEYFSSTCISDFISEIFKQPIGLYFHHYWNNKCCWESIKTFKERVEYVSLIGKRSIDKVNIYQITINGNFNQPSGRSSFFKKYLFQNYFPKELIEKAHLQLAFKVITGKPDLIEVSPRILTKSKSC